MDNSGFIAIKSRAFHFVHLGFICNPLSSNKLYITNLLR